MKRMRDCGALLVILAGLTVAPGWAQQNTSDAQIEGAVVDALGTTPVLMDQPITAATIEGTVTLSGSVPSAAIKKQAEDVVKKVAGVKAVENNLEIQTGQQAEQSAADAGAAAAADPMAQPAPADQNAPNPQSPQVLQTQPSPQQPGAQPAPAYQGGPVTIVPGTLLRLRTSESIDNHRSKPGDVVEFTAATDVYVGGVLAIPRGATLHGVLEDPVSLNKAAAEQAGDKSAPPPPADKPDGTKTKYAIVLRLTDVVLDGQVYPLKSDAWSLASPSTAGRTANDVAGGAVLGTIIGAIAGRGAGAAIGAVAGGTAGAIAAASAPPPRVVLPVEALVTFHLKQPLTVTPVSPQEAQRLASAAQYGPRGPVMYRRGYYAPPPPPYYYGGARVVFVP